MFHVKQKNVCLIVSRETFFQYIGHSKLDLIFCRPNPKINKRRYIIIFSMNFYFGLACNVASLV